MEQKFFISNPCLKENRRPVNCFYAFWNKIMYRVAGIKWKKRNVLQRLTGNLEKSIYFLLCSFLG